MKIQAPKGTKDILPREVNAWRRLENEARLLFGRYGYKELHTPIFESTDLFKRGIGEGTDIVQKEMYTFLDPKGRSLTLRPEGTASVVRAYMEHHLSQQGTLHKLFYMGPMCRYERPQTGRMRQFHQIGVEVLGSAEASLDAEVMIVLMRYLDAVGIRNVTLKINTLGTAEDRENFQKILRDYLKGKLNQFCGDCYRRYETNVLRVLDCKQTGCQDLLKEAPSIADTVSKETLAHFDEVCVFLDVAKITYQKEPFLVRGLDYYTGTVFEVGCSSLGAQDAIAAGGRYDGLVKTMGGPDTPAVGFAFGLERLLVAREAQREGSVEIPREGIFLAALGANAFQICFALAEELRIQGSCVGIDHDRRSLKAQMRFADKARFRWLILTGDEELQKRMVQVKDLQEGTEEDVSIDGLLDWAQTKESKI